MFCTVSRFQASPENLKKIYGIFKAQYIQAVSQQPGFKEVSFLTNPNGRFIIINNWETIEQASKWAKNPEYQNIIFQIKPMLESAISPEGYEVEVHSASGLGQ